MFNCVDAPYVTINSAHKIDRGKLVTLPTAYLTSVKRLPEILVAIQSAQAPETFSTRFLANLGFKAKVDRLVIGVLKSLSFLDESGKPTNRYYQFLDQSQSGQVLADAIRDAYSDLFALNINAHQFGKQQFIGKIKTLSQGQLSDRVMEQMYLTFNALVKNADFTSQVPFKQGRAADEIPVEPNGARPQGSKLFDTPHEENSGELRDVKLGGLVYNIQIVLPETRDAAVYDALFRSLKEHLL